MPANPLPIGHETITGGTLAVVLVSSPVVNVQRLVRTLTLFNADTANVVAKFAKKKAGTTYILMQETLAPGSMMIWGETGETQVLDATDETIVGMLSATVATNQCHMTSAFADTM